MKKIKVQNENRENQVHIKLKKNILNLQSQRDVYAQRAIKDTLKNNNDIHIKVLYELLKNKFTDLDISRQYIHDIIRDNNITRKRATFEHFPKTYRGEPRDEEAELKAFFKEIKKFNLDDIISIDETSVSTSLGFNYC